MLPRVINGEDGVLTWSAIAPAIRPKVYYRPQTSLICLENTVNMAGGTVYPTAVVEEICDRAHEQDIHVHLDGARVFNAATYLNEPVSAMTRKFDSVQFCLSKGLGAPVGSMIVGQPRLHRALPLYPQDARRRHAPGGRARRGWNRSRSKMVPSGCRSITTTRRFSRRKLAAIPGIALDPSKVQTNIVIFSVKPSGLSSADFLSRCSARGRVGGSR